MNRLIRLPLAGAACILIFGCRGETASPKIETPLFAVSDGAHNGNPDFFFLPPLFKNPTTDPNYEPLAANVSLKPTVEICELGAPATDGSRECVALIKRFDPSAITIADQQYQVNWKTDESHLDVNKFYRIRVLVGTSLLGFADVDPVSNGSQLKNVQTNEYIGLQDGRTLPIKFRIESGALCAVDGTPCASKTINLAQGGGIELLGGGEDFKIDIPSGTAATFKGQAVANVTVNAEICAGIDVDLPKVGACLRLSTYFDAAGDGELEFSKPVLISLCVLNSEVHNPNETRQEGLVTLHQQDGTLIRALPHAVPSCNVIGSGNGVWDRLKNFAARLITPTAAHAAIRTAVLHVGAGGETGTVGAKCSPSGSAPIGSGIQLTVACPPSSPIYRSGPQPSAMATVTPPKTVSDFQFALPAKMDYLNPDDAQRTASPGSVLPTAVKVTDWDGTPVLGARVTFTAPIIEGIPTVIGTVISDVNGVAQIPWTIVAGSNTAVASGRGIAAQNNYPNATVKPFMPDISFPVSQQSPVALGIGKVTFTATGTTAGDFIVVPLKTALEYPTGLWIANGDVYFTESADHNTSFGGRSRLSRMILDGNSLETLLDNPHNADAVVVSPEGSSIYLASYDGTSPGESGHVSVVTHDPELGWFETPVTDVAIAAHDMFMEANQDIYLIGSSSSPTASSLYLLASDHYGTPSVFATGLGGAQSITGVNGDLYYSVLGAGEVHSISDGADQVVFSGPQVLTLTYDGTFLYYGDLAGNLRRRNLLTGAEVTLFSGAGQINAARYDAATQTLYFLCSGTEDAQYKNGSLNSIYLGPVIP